jgi:hypothetical protein
MGAHRLTSSILRDLRSVDVRTVPALRPIRRKWSKELASASPQETLQVARDILASDEAEFRFIAYEGAGLPSPAQFRFLGAIPRKTSSARSPFVLCSLQIGTTWW